LFDTNLVVVGNVLTAPEWRRVQNGGSLVANFRVASTARRFDRSTDRWVDGNNMRVRVVAWRRLAEGVASSIAVGDPVIIYGRVYTRDWKDENGTNRTSYEMEAFSIGHDLARGRARFFRAKTGQATTVVEDAESDAMVGGELTVELGPDEPVIAYGEGLPEGEEPTFQDVAPGEPGVLSDRKRAERADEAPAGEAPAGDDLDLEVERLVAAQPAGARRTRRTKREPVAA
jgi:single-strand DNA-binding protein